MLGLPLNELIQIKMEETVQRNGVYHMMGRVVYYPQPEYMLMQDIYDNFTGAGSDWHLWNSKGGRWTTRFAKVLKERYDAKLDPKLRANIGETLKRYMEGNRFIVVSDTIDWIHGAFGDGYSCFVMPSPSSSEYSAEGRGWKCGTFIRRNPNAYAIKEYKSRELYEANPNKGIGRCFGYVREEGLYLVNTVGGTRQPTIAGIAKLLNLPFKDIDEVMLGWGRESQGGAYYLGTGKPVRDLKWDIDYNRLDAIKKPLNAYVKEEE